MNEGLESELRDRISNFADVVERIFPRKNYAVDSDLLHHSRAGPVVHRHLRRAVDLEAGVNLLNQANESDVLHDRGVDAAVNRLSQKRKCLIKLGRLDERVERQINARAATMRDAAGGGELISVS